MSSPTWERISRVFNDALEVAPEARDAFVRAACGEDDALRREVEAMLATHDSDTPLAVENRLLRETQSPEAMAGTNIGAYRIERLIGRGGMGDVYLAERSDDHYEHRVALKLIRPGLHGEEVSTRFRQERQILAQLEHPNIAALLDGGVSDDGRPYLVMQYVDGVPITEYCTANSLSVHERLGLFRTVCQAVHAAHANLVVHRDLKPANILVTSEGTVKLLDFGIAKLLDPTASAPTQSLMMTPDYAAPEQVAGEAITTATDVYALGVLLYQLLTGERPLDIPTTSAGEIERVIREVEPPPPSSRASQHARALRGDLDHIVLMALRKEPERRYQSALELDDDIERHLSGQPVRAQPNSFGYRARKFLRRNRAGVAVAAVIVLLTGAFVGTTLKQSQRVARERDRAQAEQAKAERIVDVLAGLLSQANPTVTPGGDQLRVADLIDQIEEEVEGLTDQPLVQARMWEMLAEINFTRSRYDDARAFLDRALAVYEAEPDRVGETARVHHTTAALVLQTRGAAEAEPLLRASVARHRELFGNLHRDTSKAIQELASALLADRPGEAMKLINEAMLIEQTNGDPQSMNMAAIFNRLGIYYYQLADYATSKDNFEKSLVILESHVGGEHPHVLAVSNNIASCMVGLGNYHEAELLQRELIDIRRRILGPKTQGVAVGLESLAGALAHQGKLEQARGAYDEALGIYEAVMGKESGYVANTLRNLGVICLLQNRAKDGVALFDRAIEINEQNNQSHTRSGWYKRGQRAYLSYVAGERERAVGDMREALSHVDRLALSEADAYRAATRVCLAVMLIDGGENGEAEGLLREAIEIHRGELPEGHVRIARDWCLLGAALALGDGSQREAQQLLDRHQPAIASWGMVDPLVRDILTRAREALASK